MKHVLKMAYFVSVILTSSCGGSADNKVDDLAKEMCSCFDSFQNNLSEDGKKLMKEIATAAKPQDVMIAGMAKLKPEDSKAFGEQLKSLADKNSTMYICLQEFDKRHAKETTTNKNALTEKLLLEMQKNSNCFAGAAILNLNPKQK